MFYIEIPARLWYNIFRRRCAVGFEANCVQAVCLFFHPSVRVANLCTELERWNGPICIKVSNHVSEEVTWYARGTI